MFQKIEKTIIGIVFGSMPVVTCFLAGWWLSYLYLPETLIGSCAIGGLLLGAMFDIWFFRNGLKPIYTMKPIFWILVYLFYSICVFGFFMGVPVFNVILAPPAGLFVGGWLARSGADAVRARQLTKRTAVFTTLILLGICMASAVIALSDPSTGANLEGMFRLNFEVTPPIIVSVIFLGGLAILGLQWWLVEKSVEVSYKLLMTNT
jgi:hypothetical protein